MVWIAPALAVVLFVFGYSMVELAKVNGIRVILASVTPVCDCYVNQTARRPQGKIIGLNGWIKDYAARSGSVYLDYYAALAALEPR